MRESTNSGEKTIRILFQHPDPEKNEEHRRTAEENWRIEEEKGKRGFGKSLETITNWLSLAKPPRLTD
jgi:hypothetical protein